MSLNSSSSVESTPPQLISDFESLAAISKTRSRTGDSRLVVAETHLRGEIPGMLVVSGLWSAARKGMEAMMMLESEVGLRLDLSL
ncbi:hypothetical protein LINPERPRIM_LOCUS1847 [Linum perenne]